MPLPYPLDLLNVFGSRKKRDAPQEDPEIENASTKKRPKPPENGSDRTGMLSMFKMAASPATSDDDIAVSAAGAPPPPAGPGLFKKRVPSGPSVTSVKRPLKVESRWQDEPLPTVGELLRESKVLHEIPVDDNTRIRFMPLSEEQALRFEVTRRLRRDDAIIRPKPLEVRCPAFRVLPPEEPLPAKMLSRRSERLLELCDSDEDEDDEGEEGGAQDSETAGGKRRCRSTRSEGGSNECLRRGRSRSSNGGEEGQGVHVSNKEKKQGSKSYERHNRRDENGKFIPRAKEDKCSTSEGKKSSGTGEGRDSRRVKGEKKGEGCRSLRSQCSKSNNAKEMAL